MKKLTFSIGLLCVSIILGGCDSQGTSNIVDGAEDAKIAEYEKALAEADAMSEGYEGVK
ncbi:hypothetical protein [Allorhodopirellula heiligendammensis]|uniref:Uncharacterized protein n=1 Tax=Allorhodopirellula heiligendammensis TaxID=2714739 RepID=A0A5C6C9N6_9BACT|nr:hypothetical protein [Allorhodopirellula heiligendammensis]TWU19479.1 hypothetical protein Poly21_16520 [Allorhodopirellula heiligendammensis]